MNIFVLDESPLKSAELLWADNKKRALKQIVENMQLISNTIWNNSKTGFYKKSHYNHPASKWICENDINIRFVLQNTIKLIELYQIYYNKNTHKCNYFLTLFLMNFNINGELPKYFYNGARNKKLGLDFTHIQDVPIAYKEYLKARKELAI